MRAIMIAVRGVVALASLVLWAGIAEADTVAVLDVTGSAPDHAAVAELRRAAAVAGHTAVADPDIRAALTGPLGAEPRVDVSPGTRRLELANDAYLRLDLAATSEHLTAARTALLALEPTPAVVQLLADTELLRGQQLLSAGDAAGAREAFALSRRLSPGRAELDPSRFPPPVRRAYASSSSAQRATLRVTSSTPGARVIVDGQDLGVAPVATEIGAGAHYVWLKLADHRGTGHRVLLSDDSPVVELGLVRSSREDRIRARRRRLAAGEMTATLCEQLAVLAGVEVLLLVDRRGDRPRVAAFDRRAPAALVWERPSVIEARLAREPPSSAPLEAPIERTSATPWYRSGWAIGLTAGGVAAATVAAVILLGRPDNSEFDGTTGIRIGDTWTVE